MNFLKNLFKKEKKVNSEGLPQVVNRQFLAQCSQFMSQEMTDEELERIRKYEEEKAAITKDVEWLRQEVYDHVCWNEGGSGMAMMDYMKTINQELSGNESEEEIIAYKQQLIGY